MRTFSLVLFSSLSCAVAGGATWRVSVSPANIALFDAASSKGVVVSGVGPGGSQSLIAIGLPPDMNGYRIDLRRPDAAVPIRPGGVPNGVLPKTVGSSQSNVAWMIPKSRETVVVNNSLAVEQRLDAPRYSPYAGIALAGRKLFGIGGFVEEPYDSRMGSRTDWMHAYGRQDCALFYVDLASPGRQPHPVICDKPWATKFDRTALGLGLIAAAPDEQRVYAVIERNMTLYVIPAGKPESARTVSLLRNGQKTYQLTNDDMMRMTTPGFFFEIRSRMRSPQGIVFGPQQTVAVIFREKGELSRFTADVFDAAGRLLAGDVPVPLPQGGVRRYAEAVNLPSGEHFLFVSEPDAAFKKPIFQNLYRIELTYR